MRQELKEIIIRCLLLFLVPGGLNFWLIVPLDWEAVSSKSSPGGWMVAYHLQSNSEAGEAPYGDHIVLARRYLPFTQYYSEAVFAAYSANGLQNRWLDDHRLSIECTAEKVIKKIGKYGNVMIEYQIYEQAPHNKSPESDT